MVWCTSLYLESEAVINDQNYVIFCDTLNIRIIFYLHRANIPELIDENKYIKLPGSIGQCRNTDQE